MQVPLEKYKSGKNPLKMPLVPEGDELERKRTHWSEVNPGQCASHSCLRGGCGGPAVPAEGLSNEPNMGELGLTERVSTNQRQTGAGRCTGSSLKLSFFPPPPLLLLGAPATTMRLSTKPETITRHSRVSHRECPALKPSYSEIHALSPLLSHPYNSHRCAFNSLPWGRKDGEGRPSRVIGSKSL